MTSDVREPTTSRGFLFLWLGQMVSLLGSGMTTFALSILTYQKNDSVSELSAVVLAFALPGVLAAPLAGTILDRFDRRLVLGISALGSALSTLAIAGVLLVGPIEMWQILLCVGAISLFGSAQIPAVTALTAALVSKENLARVNGVWQMTGGLAFIVSPLVAGVLLQHFGIATIVTVDFFTYLVAIGCLFMVRTSASDTTVADPAEAKPSAFDLQALTAGWRHVVQRGGLLRLLAFMGVFHIALDMIQILLVPLMLGRGTPTELATLMTVSALGMMTGGITMAVWGGPKRKISAVLVAAAVMGVGLAVVGLEAGLVYRIAGMVVVSIAVPICLSCNETIWQSRVEATFHGRVFALEAMVGQAAQPLACLIAPIACHWVGTSPLWHGVLVNAGAVAAKEVSGLSAGIVLAGAGVVVLAATMLAALSARLRAVEGHPDSAALVSSEPATDTR